MEDRAKIETRAMGVYYRRQDGGEFTVRNGDALEARRDPENPYDENAISLHVQDGERIGWVARYLSEGLAEAMASLRQARLELDPAYRQQRDVQERINADRARIARTLATHPHPDPADLDPEGRAERYAGKLTYGYRERRDVAQAAQVTAMAALHGRGTATTWLHAFGYKTAEQRQADNAVARALALTDQSEQQQPTPEDYKHARATGSSHAYAAQADTRAWEARPQVAQAIEQQRLNVAVEQAANVGDIEILRALKGGDPEAARQVILLREVNMVVFAFGTPTSKALLPCGMEVAHTLQDEGISPHALRLTAANRPWHPLYLPEITLPMPWIT